MVYTAHQFQLYGLYCKLLRCIWQTPSAFELWTLFCYY